MSNIIKLKKKVPPPLKIGVIIQARMTSTRFPGKSMALLMGTPVLEWVIKRAKYIRGPRKSKVEVIVALPDTDESEPMLVLADKLGVSNFCGTEHNVLKRYYDAAKFFNFDVIMRITADCPFIDPRVCSEVLQLLLWRKLDYTSNVYPERTYPKGLDCEAFTFDTLEAASVMASTIYELEHVTPWMQNTPEVRKGNVKQKDNESHKNWCVDYPEDIERLENDIKEKTVRSGNDNEKS